MGKAIRQAAGRTAALLLFPFYLPFKAILALWRGLGRAGLYLRQTIAAIFHRAWAFLGRLGLALRNLLTWFIWRPAVWIFTQTSRPALAVWRFLGRLGLALRNLLTWFVWRPFLFAIRPLRWLWRHWLRPLLAWFWRRIIVRAALALAAFGQARWQASWPFRQRWQRRWRSRRLLWQARLRLLWQRPPQPRSALRAPAAVPRAGAGRRAARLATLSLTLGVILLVGFITTQSRQPEWAVADTSSLPTSTPAEPSPMPSPTAILFPVIELEEPAPIAPGALADPLSSGGSVAFTLRQNGHKDIYVLSPGQTEPVRLTNHPSDNRSPAWSPDGRQIAFASNRAGGWNIYTLDLESGILRRVTSGLDFAANPSWSPDGQWLVYEGYRQGSLDIYITRADGSGDPLRLTEHPAPDFSPHWSPDGRHIAFTSWRAGNKDIFIMPLDAASDQTVINATNSPGRQEDDPAFSPDGRYLAYSDNSAGFDLVYALPLENARPAGEPVLVGQGRYPSWSPDGLSLVYVHNREERSYLIAATLDAWSVATQAFASQGRLSGIHWSAAALPSPLPAAIAAAQGESPALFVEALAEPAAAGPPYRLWPVAVNAPFPYLSDRVNDSFDALRQRVIDEAGWDFLGQVDNMFEPLDARPLPGQSARTWNKAGRAFDVYFRHALANEPQVEVVREDRGNETYWRIYLRAARQDGSQGEPLRERPWDFQARYGFEPRYYDQGGKLKDALPAGYYVDFTTLAADYGWQRAPAAENWRTYFPGIRFWHFQNRQGLSWQEAMLEIYRAEDLETLEEGP